MGLGRRIWNERISRRAIKGLAFFTTSMALIHMLPGDRVITRSRTVASVQAAGERPAGGLSVNGISIPYKQLENIYENPSPENDEPVRKEGLVSLDSLVGSGDYSVEFVYSGEHPAQRIEYRFLDGDGSRHVIERRFDGEEYESIELRLTGDTKIESVGIWLGYAHHEVEFR